MSQRWLKFLEKFGTRGKSAQDFLEPEELDSSLTNPKMFGRYDVLFHLYGPLAGSPWVPYHCPTLFASLDRLSIAPQKIELAPGYHDPHPPGAWQWLGPKTMVLVDLPGAAAIEVGVTLMKHGAQFVSTFDHWPFSRLNRGARVAVKAQVVIQAMYTLAPEVHALRRGLTPDVAPVWLCDSRRLGRLGVEPTPGTFDNRYYIDDSILPGIKTLKGAGIRRLIYLNLKAGDAPQPDLVPFIIEAHKAGLTLEHVALQEEETWIKPRSMDVPFKTKLPIRGFRRTDMGGFGKMIPVPSEGSYGSGGGGG